MNVDKLNDIIKKFKIPGLDMKQVFEIDGYLFLLSTVDVLHGNDEVYKMGGDGANEYFNRYETMLFKDCLIDDTGIVELGVEVYSCSYKTEKKAIEEHNKKVWWLENCPDDVLKIINRRDKN